MEFSECARALAPPAPCRMNMRLELAPALPQQRLDEAGVRGAYVDEEEGASDAKRNYYRIIKGLDVTTEPKRIPELLKEVFNNLAMKVLVETEPQSDSDVASWIGGLRELPNLHFEK